MKLPIPGIFPKLKFSGSLLVLCLILLLALGAMFALGMLSGQLIRWEITNLPVQTRKLEALPKFTIPEDPEIEKEKFTLKLEKNIFDAKRREVSNESLPSPHLEEDVILEVKSQSEKEFETNKNHSREIVNAPPSMPSPVPEPFSVPSINQLELELRGTIVSKNPQSSYAFIAKKNQKDEKIFGKGECFAFTDLKTLRDCPWNSLKLIKVLDRKVALLKDGIEEWLIMEDPEPIITESMRMEVKEQVTETVSRIKVRSPVSPPEKKLKPGIQEKPVIKTKPGPDLKQEMLPPESEQVSRLPFSADQETFHLQREWVDEQLANFAKILQDARVVPVTVDQQTFFQFKFIKKGSIYEALGLKKDDIILAINEKMIDNVTKAMGLLQKLQSEREIALTVKRKESEKILRYYIN